MKHIDIVALSGRFAKFCDPPLLIPHILWLFVVLIPEAKRSALSAGVQHRHRGAPVVSSIRWYVCPSVCPLRCTPSLISPCRAFKSGEATQERCRCATWAYRPSPEPDYRLRARVRQARTGITADTAIAGGERAVSAMAARYPANLSADVAALTREIANLAPAFARETHGRVAAALCRYLEGAPDDAKRAELLDRHAEVLANLERLDPADADACRRSDAVVTTLEQAVDARLARAR